MTFERCVATVWTLIVARVCAAILGFTYAFTRMTEELKMTFFRVTSWAINKVVVPVVLKAERHGLVRGCAPVMHCNVKTLARASGAAAGCMSLDLREPPSAGELVHLLPRAVRSGHRVAQPQSYRSALPSPRSRTSTRSTTRHSSAFDSRTSVPIVGVVTPRSSLLMNIVFVPASSASWLCVRPRATRSWRRCGPKIFPSSRGDSPLTIRV